MAKTVIGLFNSKTDAERAVTELASAGFPRTDIDLIARNGVPAERDVVENLTRVGVPGGEAREYTARLSTGKALVLVRASETAAPRAVTVMERNAGKEMDRDGAASAAATPPPAGPRPASVTPPPAAAAEAPIARAAASPGAERREERKLPIVEEEIKVGKREIPHAVRVFAHVVEEPVEKEITLRQEHVNVERRAVDRPATEADLREFKEGTIEVSESAEEPIVTKEPRVTEEVVISKDTRPETRIIRDTVRKTEVEVEDRERGTLRPVPAGEPRVAGAAVRSSEGSAPIPTDLNESTLAREDVARANETEAASAERNPAHFTPEANPFRDSRAGDAGVTPEHEYAFRFGESLADDPRHRGKTWEVVEPEARREWAATHKSSAWEDFKERVRHAWQRKSKE